jgi:hypothetical protein
VGLEKSRAAAGRDRWAPGTGRFIEIYETQVESKRLLSSRQWRRRFTKRISEVNFTVTGSVSCPLLKFLVGPEKQPFHVTGD